MPDATAPVAGSETSRHKTLVASLIALTTFLGAVGAWRATESGGEAADAERKAIGDARGGAQREAVIRGALADIEFNYMKQSTHRALANQLRLESSAASAEDAARLLAEAAGHDAVANAIFVDPDAVQADGALDLTAKYDIEWSLATSQYDLDPEPEFAAADRLRSTQERIVLATALFVAAALFLTLARVGRNAATRRLYFAGGVGVLCLATVALVVLEMT